MTEYLAILIGATIGCFGSILGAAVVIHRVRVTIVAGVVGFLVGAAGGQALAGTLFGNASSRTLRAPFDLSSYFLPSGWMGDAEFGVACMSFNPNYRECPREDDRDRSCMRLKYSPGPRKWAGLYWQFPENNWGDSAGTRVEVVHRVTWWAKGADGGELAEFKVGGVKGADKPYADGFSATSGQVSLGREWRKYEVAVPGPVLNVLGAFAVIIPPQRTDDSIVVFVDDVRYE